MEPFIKIMLFIVIAVGEHFQNVLAYDSDTEMALKDPVGLRYSDITECLNDRNSYCTLWCTLDDPQYTYDQITIDHYTYSPLENYTFSNDEGIECNFDNTTSTYNISIALTVVNAGYYACKFGSGDPIMSKTYHVFDFSQPTGSGIGQECEAACSCLAAFAYCDNATTGNNQTTCNCHDDYGVPYNNRIDTPACAKPATFGGDCQSDGQCQVTSNMACVNGKCGCANGYVENEETNTCDVADDGDDGLTGGEIAGIVIGTLAGVAIIGGVIFYVVKKD